ncbi:prostaglandin F2 receptor negative regulator [Xenopus laevis]|uniref:Prostaglandin F2 receptor negative regulator n=1 Tax=Xenopus laevis TaxID=8355 RepID=A0A8J0UBM2_XENLA|nr:prostaglandin F2 receptor negative regulator [Xenopus laevis]
MRLTGRLFFLLFCFRAGCVWSRSVHVPSGPMVRVEGTSVSIPCNVSDYEGPLEQNFEWTFSSSGGSSVTVLSTFDPTFTAPSYAERVSARGIQLERLSHNVVLFHIGVLSKSDEGEYTCSTPSTDATISGNYEDKVRLRVIPDTLTVWRTKGRQTGSRTVTEGGSFQLQCQALLDDLLEHTHLSLTWQLQGPEGTASDVLSLSHLGRFQAGPGYEERYSSGKVRLDTVGGDGYRLTVDGVRSSDVGEYSCVVRTWVLDPQGWAQIQEKKISVSRIEMESIRINVTVPASVVSVNLGEPLLLSCLVWHNSAGPVYTRVRWFQSSDLKTGPGEPQELLGGHDLDPTHEGASTHLLEVPRGWDTGDYTCQATVWAPSSNGTWHPVIEKSSEPIKVLLNLTVPELEVSLNATLIPQFSEEPTELVCHMTGSDGARLSVSWYYTPSPQNRAPQPLLLGTLDQDWMVHVGDHYKERLESGGVILSRKSPQTFVLRIQWTSNGDRGQYHCVGTVWHQQQNESWTPSREVASNPLSISWEQEEYLLKVKASVTKAVATSGGTFEMQCYVVAQNIPSPRYSVQVTMERSGPHGASGPQVLLLSREGVTHRKGESFGKAALEKVKEGEYRFRLYQAQEAGTYLCSVTAWTQGGGGGWREAKNQTSNPVALQFQTSGLMFNVTAHSDSPSIYQGDRAEFWCIITMGGPGVDTDSLAFDVSWFAQRPGPTVVLLVSVDRWAQVEQRRRNGSSEVAIERVSPMEFRLRIFGTEEDDGGGHFCSVTPWVLSGTGVWSRQSVLTSNVISLSVRMDLLNTFKYPLLLGGTMAVLVGLLSCLIGYCSSRFCCKAKPVPEPRKEHRRLMSMELD